MERVNLHLARTLAGRHALSVIGPRGCADHLPTAARCHEVALRPLPRFIASALLRVAWLALRHRPRWTVAGSGLTAPAAWTAARMAGGRSAVYVHGLDLIVDSTLYRRLWLPFIRRCDLVLVNSRHTRELALQARVPAERIRLLHPGTSVAPPRPQSRAAFRQRHGLGAGPVLLSVGRLTARKGLAAFVTHALRPIVAAHPEVQLVVIGDDPVDALNAATADQGKAAVERACASSGLGAHVHLLGGVDDITLREALEAADLMVFPVRELPGDVEGFGMVALEAAAHGLPTVAFAVGGVADAVDPARSGRLVPAGDYAAFAAAVNNLLAAPPGTHTAACLKHAASLHWDVFNERLHACLDEFERS